MRKGPQVTKSCKTCNEEFTVPVYRDKRGGSQASFCSNKCRFIYQRLVIGARSGPDSPTWRGDSVGYNGLHERVRSLLGKPPECEICGKKNDTPKAIDWANKSGEYKKTVGDFFALCKSCHKRYDIFLLGNRVYRPDLSYIDPRADIGRHGTFHALISIANGVRIGNDCKIQTGVSIPPGWKIGNRVFVGPGARFANDKKPSLGASFEPLEGVVEDDVVIGMGALIGPGITLGKGCVVGMGAVVIKDVLPGQTVVGNPAKPLMRILFPASSEPSDPSEKS